MTSLGSPSMLTFAVPEPAEAVTVPEVASTSRTTAPSTPSLLVSFLARTADHADDHDRNPDTHYQPTQHGYFFVRRIRNGPPQTIDAQAMPTSQGIQSPTALG